MLTKLSSDMNGTLKTLDTTQYLMGEETTGGESSTISPLVVK